MNISDIVVPIHIIILLFAAWNIMRADHMAFLWLRGRVTTLNEAKVHTYHRNTWIGLVGMIITGLFLFYPERSYLLSHPELYIKVAFVIMLLANGIVIGYLQKVAFTKSYKDLSSREKVPLFISGAVSTTGWIGAAVTAFFLLP